MLTNLGKVSMKTKGCTQFQDEQDSSSPAVKYRTYTDGLGHFAGTQIDQTYFLVDACA